ncbi:PPOX class F420-dependent oxidoreductase [Streptomyces sp. NBC_00631]|uniref:pyridoxamine 5'-phosphate oxidase family protein n=1 Tax=Streptomyces sp. NBC_00631 TaxID=2975793 RepID=UPI0030E01BF6
MYADRSSHPLGYSEFWNEHHLCTLTTLRPDGSPHVVPVGVTLDIDAGIARVITRKSSTKVANIRASRPGEAHVAVCQVDGGRWASLEGTAEILTGTAAVADAVTRYADRYGRTPAPDPERVVIEITITRAMGLASLSQPTPSRRPA